MITRVIIPYKRAQNNAVFMHQFLLFKDKFMWLLEEEPPIGIDLKMWLNEQLEVDGLNISSVIQYQLSPEYIMYLCEVNTEESPFQNASSVPDCYDDEVVWHQYFDFSSKINPEESFGKVSSWIDYYNAVKDNTNWCSAQFSKETFHVSVYNVSIQMILQMISKKYFEDIMPSFPDLSRLRL